MLIFWKVLSIGLGIYSYFINMYLSITGKNTCDLLEIPATLPPPWNTAHGAAEMEQTHHAGKADPS